MIRGRSHAGAAAAADPDADVAAARAAAARHSSALMRAAAPGAQARAHTHAPVLTVPFLCLLDTRTRSRVSAPADILAACLGWGEGRKGGEGEISLASSQHRL